MAKYVVSSGWKQKPTLIKCYRCKTLYMPDSKVAYTGFYEKCPVCKYSANSESDCIPLWKYNLIRYWRELWNRKNDK